MDLWYGFVLLKWSGGGGQLRESPITQENKRAQNVGKTRTRSLW